MSKTGLSVVTAFGLILLSGTTLFVRWSILGADIHGPRGASTWKVTLLVAGELTANDAVLTLVAPPDFRHQHTFDANMQSKELFFRVGKGQKPDRNEVVFRRVHMTGMQPF